MEVTFAPRSILQIDDARICFRNFRGEGSMYNNEGDRNFAVVIPNEEIADALKNDVNKFGVGWNVKIKAPREEGDAPFMYLPVKVRYTDRSAPAIYLTSGKNKVKLTEETIGMLDDIELARVDLDIRPYDSESRFGQHRTAYLKALYAVQNVDRFADRFAEEESPEEDEIPFK